MNRVYHYLGYSKQAFHQKLERQLREEEHFELLLPIVRELREEHPGVAARELYLILRPEQMGRDKFEQFCFAHGFKLERKRAYHRTTDSSGVTRFDNLVAGMELNGINQAWSSDITYYRIGETFYYITFIIDLFSRKIVGYSVSKRLLTEQTTIPALEMAIAERKPAAGLIFHSDGGGQYYSKEFLQLTQEKEIRNSMCESVYENAHAERVNGTIKNQYLIHYRPLTFQALVKMTQRAVNNYNTLKPHSSLEKLSPVAFEQRCLPAAPACQVKLFAGVGSQAGGQQKKHHLASR